MTSSSFQDSRELESRHPFLSPSYGDEYDEESLQTSHSSVTLHRSASRIRPRRRVSVQNFSTAVRNTPQRTRNDSDASSESSTRGYTSGFRRRSPSSSPSLFGLRQASNPNEPQPPLPSLKVISAEFFLICSLYCKYATDSLRMRFRRVQRKLYYVVVSLATFVLIVTAWMSIDFYMDAVRVCTPPPDYGYTDRPLVEYYVHCRGMGHYERSVAIVEKLNQNGIDVRMFLSRAAMWRAMHEDFNPIVNEKGGENVGTTTAIPVASLTPTKGPFESISHTMERIVGDCGVASQNNRYPHLVISDGDFPGMLRAAFGGIPSVGIAHGQLFSIAQKPSWVKSDTYLNRAWNSQGRLNAVSSFFSKWQIATHFCFIESRVKSGVLARAPLRPEVIQMAEYRKQARRGRSISGVPRIKEVKRMLLPDANDQKDPSSSVKNQNYTVLGDPFVERKKLVICYFRDHNGEMVVRALLDAGFDVLLFDNEYSKESGYDPGRYGVKWIVRNSDEKTRKELLGLSDENHTAPLHLPAEREEMQRRLRDVVLASGSDSPQLIRVMDRSMFVPLMYIADGVASSAGSQLMSECIYSHMPLLALYLENDDEQKLNAELSRHPGPCHSSQVFGASFESLNQTASNDPPIVELKKFVKEVRSSRVSETFYKNVNSLGVNSTTSLKPNNDIPLEDEDNENDFRGLPDAAAIIMEIIKRVSSD